MKNKINKGSRFLTVAAVLFLTCGILVQIGANGVFVRNLNYNAGAVKSGAIINYSATVVNLSLQPVLVSTEAGCGCTDTELTEKPVAPLHTLIVRAQVHINRKKLSRRSTSLTMYFKSGGRTWQETAHIEYTTQ